MYDRLYEYGSLRVMLNHVIEFLVVDLIISRQQAKKGLSKAKYKTLRIE
jgi:hypothetical protein